MEKQLWAIQDDKGNVFQVKANFKPFAPNYVKVVPGIYDELTGLPEEPEWLQIESIEIQNNPGVFNDTATVNDIAKTQKLAERLADQNAKDIEKASKKQLLVDAKKAVEKIKTNSLSTPNGVRQSILELKDLVLEIEKRLINIETGV